MNNIIIPSPVDCKLTDSIVQFNKFKVENADLTSPYALESVCDLFDVDSEYLLVFEKLEYENDQAYKILIDAKGIVISGASAIAFIYAIATLKQIIKIDKDVICLPEGEIFDYPEFKYRGVNWNLLAEVRGWSHDAGDGKDAFIQRSIEGLDLLASFKLNMVFVDGVGWNSERFPGYGKMMKKLNQEARRRGIHLCYAGYNAGYGAQWYDFDGEKFKNQKSYPNGEVYPCIGDIEESRILGTCLSNEALIEEKCKELRKFVQDIEPGALYIHGLDIANQDQCINAWRNRCDECRKKWPNEDINAVDGMAGAFAYFYDKLYEGVIAVENPNTDYDASRDCMVNMVSPNYTYIKENDESWRFHLEYFSILSECLKNDEIYLMFREQAFNEEESEARFKQLRKTLGDKRKLACMYFSSGSGFYNTVPVTADAAIMKLFASMDAVCAGSGNAFQEPRQVVNAEYMWNPYSPFQIDLPEKASLKEFFPYYEKLCDRTLRPESIFGEQGLIDVVCQKLYGDEAGLLVAEAQKMQTSSDSTGAIIAPLWNKLLPGWVFSSLKNVKWQEVIEEEVVSDAKKFAIIMEELMTLNQKAHELYTQASETGKRQEHLKRMAKTCKEGVKLASITQKWLNAFILALESPKDVNGLDILMKEVDFEISEYKKLLSNVIDPNGGDMGQVVCTLEYISYELKAIEYTLQHGKYLKSSETPQWW